MASFWDILIGSLAGAGLCGILVDIGVDRSSSIAIGIVSSPVLAIVNSRIKQ